MINYRIGSEILKLTRQIKFIVANCYRYAIEAIKLGSTCLGITTKEGVVLVVEKRMNSPLIVPSSVKKAFIVDDHIGCAASGLIVIIFQSIIICSKFNMVFLNSNSNHLTFLSISNSFQFCVCNENQNSAMP